MSDDLIERLRNFTEEDAYAMPWTFGAVVREAANEITRLRARLEQAERERDNYNAMYEQALITATQLRKYGFRAGIEAAANRDRIERLMKSYHLTETVDDEGLGYPLVDALSCSHSTVLEGEKEIFALADYICGDIRSLSLEPTFPHSGKTVDETVKFMTDKTTTVAEAARVLLDVFGDNSDTPMRLQSEFWQPFFRKSREAGYDVEPDGIYEGLIGGLRALATQKGDEQ